MILVKFAFVVVGLPSAVAVQAATAPRVEDVARATEFMATIKAAKAGDSRAMRRVLERMKNIQGFAAADFSMRLFEIFDVQPELVIDVAQAYFAGQMECLAYWLIPKTREVEFREVRATLDRALKRNASSRIKDFAKLADRYEAGLLARRPVSIRACIRYFYQRAAVD